MYCDNICFVWNWPCKVRSNWHFSNRKTLTLCLSFLQIIFVVYKKVNQFPHQLNTRSTTGYTDNHETLRRKSSFNTVFLNTFQIIFNCHSSLRFWKPFVTLGLTFNAKMCEYLPFFVRSLLSAWSLHRNRRYWQVMLCSDWPPHVRAALPLVSPPTFTIRPLEALGAGPAIKLSVTTKIKMDAGGSEEENIRWVSQSTPSSSNVF